ncbi:unnamed protein product [Pleuronectes platessa]|uniref:Uncharacterized protein n=1 Tax=Pleuronectes platessa TaxID=8262 RepID=A0A9N7ZE09_PLEPL|nr:unnamed protein product [Pleuronectes platessa]
MLYLQMSGKLTAALLCSVVPRLSTVLRHRFGLAELPASRAANGAAGVQGRSRRSKPPPTVWTSWSDTAHAGTTRLERSTPHTPQSTFHTLITYAASAPPEQEE